MAQYGCEPGSQVVNISQPTQGPLWHCTKLLGCNVYISTGAQSIPGDPWLRALKGWSHWAALITLSSSFWKTSVASGCGSKKARISTRWFFLSCLSSKWCPHCAWGSIPLWSRALEAFKNHISFCKKIGNFTLSYLCRKYTTNSPFVAQSKAVLNVSGDKLLGDTSQGKLPAAVCGWAVGVCWHITLLPMFWGCETGGGDLLLYLLCVTLVCVGFHPTPHPRSTPPRAFHLPSEREIYQLLIVFGVFFDAVTLFF